MEIPIDWSLYLAPIISQILFKNTLVTVALTFATFMWINYYNNRVELYYDDNERNREIIKRCSSLRKYKPTPYFNGFLHTVFSSVLPNRRALSAVREDIKAGISVDWVQRDPNDKNLLFIMPGLTGNVKDSYINQIVVEALEHGYKNICVYNYRLMSKDVDFYWKSEFQDHGIDMKPRDFSETYTTDGFVGLDPDGLFFLDEVKQGTRPRVDIFADVHYTLKIIKEKYGFNNIQAICNDYETSKHVLMVESNYAITQVGSLTVSVGVPYSMIISSTRITYVMDMIINRLLVNKTKFISELLQQKRVPLEWDIEPSRVNKTTWVCQFDEEYTRQVYGYKTVGAYYRHFSPINRIDKIKIPLLYISTYDDGVVHHKAVCKDEILLNKNAILCMTGVGGHIGFVEGWIPQRSWLPKPALEFLSSFVEGSQN